MSESLLGLDAVAYYLASGTRSTWGAADSDGIHEGAAPAELTEMGNVTDVTLGLSKGEADATTRSADGWRLTRGTLKEGEVNFDMVWDPTDTAFNAIFKAWLNNTPIAMAFLDQAKSVDGATGLWADFDVIKFEKQEPLENVQKVSCSIKPTRSSVAPEWVRVSA